MTANISWKAANAVCGTVCANVCGASPTPRKPRCASPPITPPTIGAGAGWRRPLVAFDAWPAVIRSRVAVVDLFPGILADVVDEHPAGAGLEGEGERDCAGPAPRWRGSRRWLCRRTGCRRDGAVRVDPQHLAVRSSRPGRCCRRHFRPRRCTACRPVRSEWRRRCDWSRRSGCPGRGCRPRCRRRTTSPLAVKRLTRLCSGGFVVV